MSEELNITAAGVFSVPLDGLRTLIANAASFQEWVGVTTSEEAIDHVYVEGVDVESDGDIVLARPYALVAFDSFRDDSLSYFRGTLVACFEANIPMEHARTHREAMFSFVNTVGEVVNEIKSASLAAGALIIRTISSMNRPARSGPHDTESDYAQIWIRVEYGLE